MFWCCFLSLPNSKLHRFPLCCLLRISVLHLTRKPINPLWVGFCKGFKVFLSRLLFLLVDIQLFQHYLLKRLSFLHWIAFAPLSKISWLGTSMVVQRLRLCAPNVGCPGLISAQEIRSHMPQQKKIPQAATKTQHSQRNKINKYFKRDWLAVFVWIYFWALYSIPFIYLSIGLPWWLRC